MLAMVKIGVSSEDIGRYHVDCIRGCVFTCEEEDWMRYSLEYPSYFDIECPKCKLMIKCFIDDVIIKPSNNEQGWTTEKVEFKKWFADRRQST